MARNNRNNYKHRREQEIPNEINNIISDINSCEMLSKIDIKDLVDENGIAYKVAGYAVDTNLKSNQLRNFFGFVKKMERRESWDKIKSDFYLLKPRMAVKVGRNDVPEGFFKVIAISMDKVDVGSEEEKLVNFKRFIEFFESIVAYHKYLGGGD